MTIMTKDQHCVNVRMEKAQYDGLKNMSLNRHRSISGEIRLAIETHIVKFKAEQGEQP